MQKEKLIKLIHRNLIHLEAIAIIICFLVGFYFLYIDHQIKEDIRDNCGWAEEDYECLCRKFEVDAMKTKARQTTILPEINLTLLNNSLASDA